MMKLLKRIRQLTDEHGKARIKFEAGSILQIESEFFGCIEIIHPAFSLKKL